MSAVLIPEARVGGRIEVHEFRDGTRLRILSHDGEVREQIFPTFLEAVRAGSDVQYAPGASPGAWTVEIRFL